MPGILQIDHLDDPFSPCLARTGRASRRGHFMSRPVPGRWWPIVSERSRNGWLVPFVSRGKCRFVLAAAALAGFRLPHGAPPSSSTTATGSARPLRSENAQLKDQMLALRSQNQDFSERAVDDARRLAQLESSNQRLETSVQAYQDERTRLESAYKELRASLPGSLQPLSSNQQVDRSRLDAGAATVGSGA